MIENWKLNATGYAGNRLSLVMNSVLSVWIMNYCSPCPCEQFVTWQNYWQLIEQQNFLRTINKNDISLRIFFTKIIDVSELFQTQCDRSQIIKTSIWNVVRRRKAKNVMWEKQKEIFFLSPTPPPPSPCPFFLDEVNRKILKLRQMNNFIKLNNYIIFDNK